MGRKKVEGSANISEVETDGLREHKAGSEKGKNKPNPNAVGQSNIVSKDKKPYPSVKVRPDETGRRGDIPITESSDPGAVKKFREEE